MVRRLIAAALALLLGSAAALAQQNTAPIPLYPGAAPRSIEPEPLPPAVPAPQTAPSPNRPPAAGPPPPAVAPPPPAAAMSAPAERIFCQQPVRVQLADPQAVAKRYRTFIGMFSDAAWTAQLCAALVVENVAADGTATIVYAFGPMGSTAHVPGGVQHGTGVIRDGELRFQNSDGSQFAFRPLYADLDGHLTTPQRQTYQAIFKRTP